jgi:2-oxo-4-hydroxy-4-carboxy-5-ureidoimidazoline decarboxylase
LNGPVSAEEAGRLDREGFVARFGDLYEHSPWVAEAAWERRPFHTREDLERAFDRAVDDAGEGRQLELIRAHPELAGSAAREGDLTDASTREQASAGLDSLSPEELERFNELNRAYRESFGFPYVVAAREHTKDSILADLAVRLGHDADAERRTALGEIAKIARLRLDGLVEAPEHTTKRGG